MDNSRIYLRPSTNHCNNLILDVEIIAPSNVPVHDYEPSAADLVKLQGTDMFFYHGLGLEGWIDATLASLGEDAPLAYSTHSLLRVNES